MRLWRSRLLLSHRLCRRRSRGRLWRTVPGSLCAARGAHCRRCECQCWVIRIGCCARTDFKPHHVHRHHVHTLAAGASIHRHLFHHHDGNAADAGCGAASSSASSVECADASPSLRDSSVCWADADARSCAPANTYSASASARSTASARSPPGAAAGWCPPCGSAIGAVAIRCRDAARHPARLPSCRAQFTAHSPWGLAV